MSKTIDWTDSYNVCHWKLFPEEMVKSTGYLECRDNGMFEYTTFFGLQAWIKQKLIAEDPSKKDVDDAEVSWNLHGDPFNREGWEYIKDLGYYPLEIQAVPEGSWIPRGNVITQIRSTDPKCSWLLNWVETELTQLWYPIVIATSDKYNKFMLWKHLEETGCENIPAVLPYMLHDFGYRGCTCREQAMIGGAAHLLNFEGSDTIAGSHYIRKYYGERMIGCSIPATNHAVITSYGKANEAKAFKMNEKRNADGSIDLINKAPVTGKGKASKAGRQALVECDNYIFSIPEDKLENRPNLLRTVYLDGELLVDEPFNVIRERANAKGFSDYYGII